jgi:hypothetical protein
MAENNMISKASKLNIKITFDVWLHITKLQLIAKSPQGVILENALEEDHGLADNNYKKARTILLDCIEDDDLMAVIDWVTRGEARERTTTRESASSVASP